MHIYIYVYIYIYMYIYIYIILCYRVSYCIILYPVASFALCVFRLVKTKIYCRDEEVRAETGGGVLRRTGGHEKGVPKTVWPPKCVLFVKALRIPPSFWTHFGKMLRPPTLVSCPSFWSKKRAKPQGCRLANCKWPRYLCYAWIDSHSRYASSHTMQHI